MGDDVDEVRRVVLRTLQREENAGQRGVFDADGVVAETAEDVVGNEEERVFECVWGELLVGQFESDLVGRRGRGVRCRRIHNPRRRNRRLLP